MWEKCRLPGNLSEKKIALAIQSGVDMKLFKGEKYVGFTRGCDAVVVAFDEFAVTQKPTPPRPIQPPGSQSSSSSDSEEPEENPAEAIGELLKECIQRAQAGESITDLLAKLGSLKAAHQTKLPTVYTWKEAKQKLKSVHWNGGAIEWWKSECCEPSLPRFFSRTRFILEPEETGVEALDKAGIVRLKLPVPVEPWTTQPAVVRRFWRGVLGYLGEFNKKMTMPPLEMCSIFDYANTYLPLFWKLKQRKYLTVPDRSEDLPLCDKDYFIRLFDFAVTIKRLGIKAIWDQEKCYNPTKQVIFNAKSFIAVRYPWLSIPDTSQLLLDTYLDQACERLWDSTELISMKALTPFEFSLKSVENVIHDCIETCNWSRQMELFTADCFGSTVPLENRYCKSNVDSMKVWSESRAGFHMLRSTEVGYGPTFLSVGRSHDFVVKKLQSKKATPEFLKFTYETKIIKRELIDLNWVLCTDTFSAYKLVFPTWMLCMGMNVPIMPVAMKDKVHLDLLYTSLIQNDDLWLGQRYWTLKLPLYKVVGDKLYANTGYAAFSRELLKRKISCLLNKTSA